MATEIFDRITIDPEICHGKPCIKGTRIFISIILECLASGETFSEILDDYPTLVEKDIIAVINYSKFLIESQKNVVANGSMDFTIKSKKLELEIAEIYENIKRKLISSYKYKELVRKETNYIKNIFLVEAEDKKLIEVYNKAFDQLNIEMETANVNTEEKEWLKSILTLDVVPYESKLYE